jgi:signal transduction histidine kinase
VLSWRSRMHADELRQLSTQLEERVAAQTMQILDQERAAATQAERTRLAREIHDTIAQGLSGIALQLGAAERALDVAPPDARLHLEIAGSMTREVLAEARRSVWNLRAPALDHGDIADALRGLAERQSRPELCVVFTQQGVARHLLPQIEAALLRVTQEALSNALRHAEATAVSITLAYEAEVVRLTVQDDGMGFDVAASPTMPASLSGGFGLAGMHERLAALGGDLALRNDDGAVVVATIPTAEDSHASGR